MLYVCICIAITVISFIIEYTMDDLFRAGIIHMILRTMKKLEERLEERLEEAE